MEYNELFKKYQKLLAENQRLKLENEDLRKRIGLSPPVSCTNCDDQPLLATDDNMVVQVNELNESGTINNSSSPEDKIKLFMSLFKGREDVYPKRWQNKKGKSGYTPVCLNEWVRGVCKKPKNKCSECNNRNYAVLDSAVIDKHLRGRDVIGIYPLLPDETCYFLAIDFDDQGWEKDISVLRDICNEKRITVSVERSRSGNGAHLWFFFEDKVSAVSARKFGTALLTHAMTKRHELKFNSYDRLFPNQDTLPKGGLGNLIALPLQLKARKSNNSVFIDEKFQSYDDQWSFLSSIRKMKESEIEQFTSQLCSGSELGDLRQDEDEDEDGQCKPWKRSRINQRLGKSDLPDPVCVTKANMLYISKNGFSQKALNTLKRLAAFRNPDFYKAQTMRLPTYDKPRIISLSSDTAEYLCLPRGCEVDLINLFSTYQVDVRWMDESYPGKPIDVEFN